MNSDQLLNKFKSKEATIGVVGLGYTGLSLAHDFGSAGFKIVGFDIDSRKIGLLQNKESYLPFMPHDQLFKLIESNRFLPTTNPEDLNQCDAIVISVPTPLNAERKPDLSFVQKACMTIASILKKQPALAGRGSSFSELEPTSQKLIILQSTTYPGTTEEVVLPLLERETGLKGGTDFFLAYVPEREDPGNPNVVLSQIPRVCGGINPISTQLTKNLYENITVKIYPCSSVKVAEATKIYENSFRLINIAFVDEMKMVFDKMGINIWEVIESASTKPFGFTAFYPGPGIGGECIPVDPLYMSWRAKQFDIEPTLINTAAQINERMAEYIVEKLETALKVQGKKLQGAKILILGVAFKKDVDDIRESPAIRIIHVLKQKGAKVSYHDYFVPELKNEHMSSIALNETTLAEQDGTIIAADHSQYQWDWICKMSRLIVDTRDATKHIDEKLKQKVIL